MLFSKSTFQNPQSKEEEMTEERQQPSPAYFAAKEQLRHTNTAYAQARFTYESTELECEALEDQINASTTTERQVLELADKKYRQAENTRKDIDTQFKKLERSDPNYQALKDQLTQAQTTKKQAKQEKDQAADQLAIARKPFEDHFAALIARKEELKTASNPAKATFEQALQHYSHICQQEFSAEDARETFDGEMTALAEEVIQIRQQVNLLSGWEKIATEILRQFVNQNPIGLTNGDLKEGKSYPFWINLAETLLGKLIDNPRHTVTFDKLARLIGIEKALSYVEKIARSKLEKDFKNESLRHKDEDRVLALEDLDEITETKYTTPRLILCHLGQLKLKDIGLLLTPDFLKTRFQEMETTEELPFGTAETLQQQGIINVRQLLQKGLREVSTTLGQTSQQVISALWKKLHP